MSEKREKLIAKTEILPFFPTLVWKSHLSDDFRRSLNDKIRLKVRAILAEINPERGELVLQTRQDLHLDPELSGLCELIVSGAGNFLDVMKLPREGIVITALWANIAGHGVGHKPHSHPNNFFSGTYYVETPPGGNRVTFHDPRPQPGIIAPQPLALTHQNAGKISVDVESGSLLLWPSWLRHSVPPNEADVDRITVSFNLMYANYTETMSPPMLQKVVDNL